MMSNITVVDHSEIERQSHQLLQQATEEVLTQITSDMESIFMKDFDRLGSSRASVLKLNENFSYLELVGEVRKEVKRLRSYESYFSNTG